MGLHVLALQAYGGGSHQAFLDGWVRHSRHRFSVFAQPPHHWKWRMRQAAVTFAETVPPDVEVDVVWATSMLDMATFVGLWPGPRVPVVLYFHENQLTYPNAEGRDDPRDVHFGLTHATSALAAIQSRRWGKGQNANADHSPTHKTPAEQVPVVWWNSAYNRDSYLAALRKVIAKCPGKEWDHVPAAIENASAVLHPGMDVPMFGGDTRALHENETAVDAASPDRPLRIVWAARWEHDKQPDVFFDALRLLKKRGVRFEVDVLGQAFGKVPPVFRQAKADLHANIRQFGHVDDRAVFYQCLQRADVAVSTAKHEFFGLSMVEASACGTLVAVPNALAYPEVFAGGGALFHNNTAEGVADALVQIHGAWQAGQVNRLWPKQPAEMAKHAWPQAACALDDALEQVVSG